MNNHYKTTSISIALALVVAVNFLSPEVTASFERNAQGSSVPAPSPAGSATSNITTNGGLTTVTFETKPGTVRVHLPDDMRAGDTISGTVVAEPKGQTEEERAKNLAGLNGHTIIIWPQPAPGPAQTGDGGIKLPVKDPTFTISLPPRVPADPSPPSFIRFGIIQSSDSPVGFVQDNFTFLYGGNLLNPVVKDFRLPPLGQQGRPLEIFGPFDGNFSNTTLRFGPVGSSVQDFKKGPENVSGGFGVIRPLAESPRKIVFEAPSDITGSKEIMVKEGDGAPTTGTYRNVGVQLSAPKTNLMRGERTTLTVEVRGLEGIQKDVPLQLDSKGVITMEGGSFQNLLIKPIEVTPEGRYRTTREITGVQAGGFNVIATVIVRRFDFCLQDDSDPNRLFYFNSFTGDYLFACGGGSCRPGGSTGGTQTGGTPGKPSGTPQPGGTVQPGGTGTPPTPPIGPTGTTLTGIGRPTMKGCIITLSHNAPDRRIFARLDTCTKTGDANVQTNSPKAEVNITDKNTADNTVASPPPK